MKQDRTTTNNSQTRIAEVCDSVKELLLSKNEQYGDSALTPQRIFSTANTSEQIKIRIDDKINRLLMGNDSIETDEDVIKDLIGYFILLLIHMQTHTISEDDES